jgi:hypothetical protein
MSTQPSDTPPPASPPYPPAPGRDTDIGFAIVLLATAVALLAFIIFIITAANRRRFLVNDATKNVAQNIESYPNLPAAYTSDISNLQQSIPTVAAQPCNVQSIFALKR